MYNSDLTWAVLKQQLNNDGQTLIQMVDAFKYLYDKWYALTYNMTDAAILALPQFSGMAQVDLTALKFAMGVFNDMYTALHGTATLSATDRHSYLIPFCFGQ
jgi:hypothetical protein